MTPPTRAWFVAVWFAVYGILAPIGPGLLDASELAACGALLTHPHPPGEPLLMLLGKLASLVPLGNVALRFAWLSALFGALAVERFHALCLALARVREDAGTTMVTLAVAASFGLTLAMRLQVGRAEVYSLHLWLALALVHAAVELMERPSRPRFLVACLVGGLALANHSYLTVLVAAPLAVALLVGRRVPPRWLPLGGALVLAGLAAYAYLPLRSGVVGAIGWGDASSASGLWDFVSAKAFQSGFAGPSREPAAGPLAVFLAEQVGVPASLPVLATGVWGLVRLVRRRPAVGVTIVVIGLLALGSRALWSFDLALPDTHGYFGLALAVLLAGVAVALDALSRSGAFRGVRVLASGLAIALALSCAWPRDSLAGIEGAAPRRLGREMLGSVEPNAVVLLSDNNLLFLTWYLQGVEGFRPDVVVLYRGFEGLAWQRERVRRCCPDLLDMSTGDLPSLRRPGRPVYVDYGLHVEHVAPSVRGSLREDGVLLRIDGDARPRPLGDLRPILGTLDPQSRRIMAWLHFQHACFHAERGDRVARDAQLALARGLYPGQNAFERLAAEPLVRGRLPDACRPRQPVPP